MEYMSYCGCEINFGVVHLVKAHNHLISSNAMKFKNFQMKSSAFVTSTKISKSSMSK